MGKAEGSDVESGCTGVMGKQQGHDRPDFWLKTTTVTTEYTHPKKTTVHIYPLPTSVPLPQLICCRQGIIVTLQTSVPAALHYQGNVSHITRGRGEITIFTPPISLSGADTLQNKSQCLSPNLVWQRVATRAILGSLWCQSPISPVTFFQRKSRFPRDSALCNFHSVFLHIERGPSSSL